MGEQINETFLTNVVGILEQARQNAKAAIDLSMVYAYFEIGNKMCAARTMNKILSGEKVDVK